MNDDFLSQFHKAPRREFAANLYKRISQPMKTTTRTKSIRTVSLALSLAMAIGAAFFLLPGTRALADDIIHQFGAVIFVQATPEPKPISNDAAGPQAADDTAKKDLQQDQAEQLKEQSPADENATASYARDAGTASQLAGFPVLAPAYLPDGYINRMENAAGEWTVVQGSVDIRASTTYGNQTESDFLTIEEVAQQADATKTVESPEIIDVTVRGQSGVWVPDHQKNLLVWEENGITYMLISNHLPLEEVLKVAESLGG